MWFLGVFQISKELLFDADCVLCMLFVGDLKKQCETVLGVVSQCCLTKHVFKMSKQYLANVALKINVKVIGHVIAESSGACGLSFNAYSHGL